MIGRPSVGLWLGANLAETITVHRRSKRIISRLKLETDGHIWGGEDALEQTVEKIARQMPSQVRRADVLLQVSIPDPLVVHQILDFEAFPDDRMEATELVALRLSEELDRDPDDLTCSFQIVARSAGTVTVLTKAINQSLCKRIQHVLEAHDLRIGRLDSWSGFLSGMGRDPKPASASAKLWQGGGWWMLSLSDANGAPAAIASGWLKPGKTMNVPQKESISAAEARIDRLVRTFALNRGVQRLPVIIAGSAVDLSGLTARLRADPSFRLSDQPDADIGLLVATR